MSDNEKTPFSVYCNSMEFGYSPWDIRLVIKEMVDIKDNQPVLIKHGTIAMSPVHAKAAMEALQKAIAVYEEQFGDIDITKIRGTIGPPTQPPV